MLQLKDLRGRCVGEKVSEWDGKILRAKSARRRRGLKELEGPRGGAHGSQGTGESCRINEAIIAYWYRMSMITCKWFGCCGIAGCLFELAKSAIQ